jgi:nucleotide-binding universal stress UspA family protein
MNDIATGPVVLAVDGTAGSAGALRYACEEAKVRETGLHVVHVTALTLPVSSLQPVVPPDLEPYGLAVLGEAVRSAEAEAPGLSITSSLVRGTRTRGIVEAAEGAQLLVLGRETRHGMERLLTGATTAGVAAHAPCPTVAVHDGWQKREGTPHVVVGIRAAADGPDLLPVAAAWAEARKGTVTVVHAWELEDPYIDRIEVRAHAEHWEAIARRVLDDALASWPADQPAPECVVRHGQPAFELAEAADGADLLMLRRAHPHRPWDRLGATVRALLLASETPVAVVPAHRAAERGPQPADPALEEPGDVRR